MVLYFLILHLAPTSLQNLEISLAPLPDKSCNAQVRQHDKILPPPQCGGYQIFTTKQRVGGGPFVALTNENTIIRCVSFIVLKIRKFSHTTYHNPLLKREGGLSMKRCNATYLMSEPQQEYA